MNRSIFQISFIHKRLLAFLGNSGTLLGLTALAALLITNAGGKEWYQHLVHLPMVIQVGDLLLEKSLQHWINDGLMAVFFLLIGLELKREFLRGYLASLDRVRIPVIAAIGGMLVPALIFLGINGGDDLLTRGWAIPTATDIAFSLGLLMALGSRVPVGLKVFLLALAILDDLGAVLIIALYYTSDLSGQAILNAGLCLAALALLNALQVKRALPYLLIGIPLWYFTLQSGVHATVAGVLLAAAIPSGSRKGPHKLIEDIEHNLHPLVSYLIIPIFAFFNAGIYVMEISFTDLSSPRPWGSCSACSWASRSASACSPPSPCDCDSASCRITCAGHTCSACPCCAESGSP